jgi:hypothetical protein
MKQRYPQDAQLDNWVVWQGKKLAVVRNNEHSMVAALVGLQNISIPLGFNATAMFGIHGDSISEYWKPTVTDFFLTFLTECGTCLYHWLCTLSRSILIARLQQPRFW